VQSCLVICVVIRVNINVGSNMAEGLLKGLFIAGRPPSKRFNEDNLQYHCVYARFIALLLLLGGGL
jgi:hypothetical protein